MSSSRRLLARLVAGALLIVLAGCGGRGQGRRDAGASAQPASGPRGRLVVLGFDGVDPRWLEQYAGEGKLPNMKRMMEANGGRSFRRLTSTNPPQSPVAWTSFATGTNPGEHGIFDFIRRILVEDASRPVRPTQGTTTHDQPDDGPPVATNLRSGIPFWKTLADDGVPVVALNVPYSFPPDPMREGRILSGLGVPDLLGTNSVFTYAVTDPPPENQRNPGGGRIVPIERTAAGQRFVLTGPPVPGSANATLDVTVDVRTSGQPGGTSLVVGGRTVPLRLREFTDFVELDFAHGQARAKGIVRFVLLAEGEQTRIFVTPISMHPRDPYMPITYPRAYAATVADDLGHLYKTVGWDHDTSSLTAEVLDDELFLRDMDAIERDRREMLLDALGRDDFRMLLWVSTATDRVAHMFYRLIDPEHPRYDAELAARHGDAIEREYRRMDETVGLVLQQLRPDDTLLILSDHGFHDYRRGLHVNTWLHRIGLQEYVDGKTFGGDFLADVDWSRTQAYAIGTGQIYLNLRGREHGGVVAPDEAEGIMRRIREGLVALRDEERGNARVVTNVYFGSEVFRGRRNDEAPDMQVAFAEYYRTSWESILGGAPDALFADNDKKWSGDHSASDVTETPGILLSNVPLVERPAIVDLAPTAVRFFGRPVPGHYVGRSVLGATR